MDLDELENGLRVRHVAWGQAGTIRQLVDVVEIHMDNGDEYEVSPDGHVRPDDLEVITRSDSGQLPAELAAAQELARHFTALGYHAASGDRAGVEIREDHAATILAILREHAPEMDNTDRRPAGMSYQITLTDRDITCITQAFEAISGSASGVRRPRPGRAPDGRRRP